MLARDVPGTCFAHIADPAVVAAAHEAGQGATDQTWTSAARWMRCTATRCPSRPRSGSSTHCRFIASTPMGRGAQRDLGRSALLRIGQVDVIVTELKSQLLDDEMLKLHGIELAALRILAIKSSQHFRAFFEGAVAKIVTVDTPGHRDLRLQHLHLPQPRALPLPTRELRSCLVHLAAPSPVLHGRGSG